MTVVSDFFRDEFDGLVRDVRRELAAGRPSYLTFTIFNVRLDPEHGLVTVEDELDPDRVETPSLAEFALMIEDHAPG